MSNSIRPPDDIQIAAMNKKKAAIRDPMAGGAGTPWEDRGSVGLVGGFFKTLGMGLFSPAKLLASIRRPETFTDARGFALACGVMWGAGLAVQSLLWARTAGDAYRIDSTMYYLGVLLEGGGAVVFTFVGLNLFANLFIKMVSTDLKGRNVPPTLMQNLTAYSLAPAVFVLVPVVGPLVAGAWTFFNFNVIGIKRLQLKFSSTFIGVLLSTIVIAGLAVLLRFVGWYLFNTATQAYTNTTPGTSFLGL